MQIVRGMTVALLGTAVLAVSANARECNPRQVAQAANRLANSASALQSHANGQARLRVVADAAYRLSLDADRLGNAAQGFALCHRLEREFADSVTPSYNTLQGSMSRIVIVGTQLQVLMANVTNDYRAVQSALTSFGPGPFPPIPGPFPPPVSFGCRGAQGFYQGQCFSRAGNTLIQFQVVDTGTSCVLTNATYFAPTALVHDGAKLVGRPMSNGSVAIRDTVVEVFGAGQFNVRGYNYAGHFDFVCRN